MDISDIRNFLPHRYPFLLVDRDDAGYVQLWDAEDPCCVPPTSNADPNLPAGSVLVLHGSTWHGGGANITRERQRYGLSIQFVAGWCRQQQNLMLGTDPELVATYPRRLQELIGYSLYQNVMGHVDREHPLTLLGQDVQPDMVWDRMGNEEKK